MNKKFENMQFEDLMNELTKIVEELESGKLSLEKSVELYQIGIELSAECKKRLDDAKEVIVSKMMQSGEVPFK